MNSTIDKMLGLTADIADELLQLKDNEQNLIPDELKIKIISLAELAAAQTDMAEDIPAEEAEEIVIEETEPKAEESSLEEAEPSEAAVAEEPAEEEIEAEPEELVEIELNEEPNEESIQEEAEVEPTAEPIGEPIAEPVAVEDVEPQAEPIPVAEPKEGLMPSVEPAEVKEAAPVEMLIDPKALQRAFSINDAFFFRREIFGGSKEAFEHALNHVATLKDYHQLQHFLVERLDLNLNKTPGKDFYQILVGFFKK
jgi:hypothetical protein